MKLDTRIPLRNVKGVPVCEDGLPAFDDKGKAIEGRTPMYVAQLAVTPLLHAHEKTAERLTAEASKDRMMLAIRVQRACDEGCAVDLNSGDQETIKKCVAAVHGPLVVGQVVMALDERLGDVFPPAKPDEPEKKPDEPAKEKKAKEPAKKEPADGA